MGNIQNRVFDSSGPEGKVRGTPQQIIDKYQTLARDAQLSNDRVAAENFQQHAEHYARMLSEAQREQEAARQQLNNDRQENNERRNDRNAEESTQRDRREPRSDEAQPEPSADAMGVVDNDDAGLVETPEMHNPPQPEVEVNAPAAEAEAPPRRRRGRPPKKQAAAVAEETAAKPEDGEAPEASA